jgi:Tol biopolymer transport system component
MQIGVLSRGRGRAAVLACAGIGGLALAASLYAQAPAGQAVPPPAAPPGVELPVTKIPIPGEAAEGYFSPDSKTMICNAKMADDKEFQVYTFTLDGTDIRRINDKGADACSFFYPDGKKLIWTSTRDNLSMPAGNFSDANNYPQGAELYTSDLRGGNLVRMTTNTVYDAEVTVSPDGKWILFARQTAGKIDLYRMRPDGTELFQITHTEDWQEGGAQWMPDGQTIIYRAWKIQDQGQRGMPMTIFTIKPDGTGLKQITTDPGTNWAPAPAPDGRHFVYVRLLPPRNFEIFMMDIQTGEKQQLTFNEAFDGFPAISPDGRWMGFSSSRGAQPGERKMFMYLMDISSLHVGPAGK